ncbi:DNA-processing protein DprA [Geomicrobium sp. JSM 1781026]|uniref:DNA-processing protein DprA n=1 Tax=Geomicrobium sp. JSM 1781026 TaxID=3344580 RepID=UPI0035BF4FFB
MPTLDIFRLSHESLQQITNRRSDIIQQWQHYWRTRTVDEVVCRYTKGSVRSVTIVDEEYPDRFRYLSDPPPVLYVSGNEHLLNCTRTLAVVGTRSPSEYGKARLNELLVPVVQQNTVIVSGLARGIDTLAHKLAIGNNGKTIAVIGSGHNHIYPKENQGLAKTISQNHLLLSEYPPDVVPQKWHFPERNRLISALGDLLFVVEAGERSGTLITVDCALEQGKDVCALPGNVGVSTSVGTNRLIQQGAKMVLTVDDLIPS